MVATMNMTIILHQFTLFVPKDKTENSLSKIRKFCPIYTKKALKYQELTFGCTLMHLFFLSTQ